MENFSLLAVCDCFLNIFTDCAWHHGMVCAHLPVEETRRPNQRNMM